MRFARRVVRRSVDGATILAAATIASALVVAWSALAHCRWGWPPTCTPHVRVVALPTGVWGAPWDAMTTPASTFQEQALHSLVRTAWLLSLALAGIAGLSLGIHAASWILTRWRPLGIRSALGAGRLHLMWAAVARPAAYTLVGCTAGLAAGEGIVSVLRRSWPAILTRPEGAAHPAALVAAVLLAVAALVACLVALVTVFLLPLRSTTGLANALRGVIGTRLAPLRVQTTLAVLQMAAVLVAMTPGAILVHDLGASGHPVSAAMDDSLAVSRLHWSGKGADSAARRSNAYADLLERFTATGRRRPIITSPGAALGLGKSIGVVGFCITCVGSDWMLPGSGAIVRIVAAAPGSLAAMRDTLLRGREFTPHDTFTTPRVAVLSPAAAYSLFPRRDPVGKQLRFPAGPDYTVVGIVQPRYTHGLGSSADDLPLVYIPLLQDPPTVADVIADAGQLRPLQLAVADSSGVADLRAVMDPPIALRRVEQEFHAPVEWFRTMFLALFAVSAALATLATASLMVHEVRVRRYEIATRAALGATPRRLWLWMTRRTLGIAGLGLLIGVTAARAGEEWFRAALGQAAEPDLTVLVIMGLALGLIGFVASLVPARQASRVEPAVLWRGARF